MGQSPHVLLMMPLSGIQDLAALRAPQEGRVRKIVPADEEVQWILGGRRQRAPV